MKHYISQLRRISNINNFNLFLAKHFLVESIIAVMTSNSRRVFKLFGHNDSILFNKHTRAVLYRRSFSIVPLFSRLLKLRYIFVGSAVGGGIAIQNVSKTQPKFHKILNISPIWLRLEIWGS